jgi:hypothetical protein
MMHSKRFSQSLLCNSVHSGNGLVYHCYIFVRRSGSESLCQGIINRRTTPTSLDVVVLDALVTVRIILFQLFFPEHVSSHS